MSHSTKTIPFFNIFQPKDVLKQYFCLKHLVVVNLFSILNVQRKGVFADEIR